MTKFKVPKLPSDEAINEILDYSDANLHTRGIVYGQKAMRDTHAAKHREAAVVAIEALELYSEGHAFCSRSVAIEALEKIKNKIYEQRGE